MMRSRHKYLFLIFVTVTCVALAVPARATVTKRLYVDGVPMGSNTVPGQLSYTFERITIASEGNRWSMYNVLKGALDEFAIYEGVLSPTDVLDHFNASQLDEPNYVAEVLSDTPQIYLRLNDPCSLDGAPANHDPGSAVARDGTYIGVVTQLPNGVFPGNKCAVFPGDVPDPNFRGCIDVWDGDRVFSFDEVSIEVWVNSANLDDNYPRLFQHNGAFNNERAYGVLTDANATGVMHAGVIGAMETSYLDTGNINDADWHHVVVTYEYTYEPNGYEDEVMKDNPVIYFRFEQDDIAHDVDVDNSGSKTVTAKYWGAAQPQPRYAAGIAGKGVFLNDETANTVVINAPAYDSGDENYDHLYALVPADMSVEVWFRSRPYYEYSEGGELNWSRLFSNNGTWTNLQSGRVMLTYNAYGIFGGGGSGEGDNAMWCEHPGFTPQADPNQDTGPADREWHHAVTIYDVNDDGPHNDPNVDPTIVMQFYLDGVLLGTRLQDPCTPLGRDGIMGPEFREFLIGAEASSGNRYNCFRGTMDEFAIYDHVLSAERISIHYQEGLAAKPWTPENCEEIFEQGWQMAADLNRDCKVNFMDMKDIGYDWWRCMRYGYPPTTGGDETCEHPWLP